MTATQVKVSGQLLCTYKDPHSSNIIRQSFFEEIKKQMNYLLQYCDKLFGAHIESLILLVLDSSSLSPRVGDLIAEIWQLEKLKMVVARLELIKVQGINFSDYYFLEAQRIARPDYIATWLDCVRLSSSSTVGTNVLDIIGYENYNLKFLDLGGSESERIKWSTHTHFNDLDSIYYFFALDEYRHQEGGRLIESIKAYRALSQMKKVPFYFIFTKRDTFEKNILVKPLQDIFKSYALIFQNEENAHLSNFEKSYRYVVKKFEPPNPLKPSSSEIVSLDEISIEYCLTSCLESETCQQSIESLLRHTINTFNT